MRLFLGIPIPDEIARDLIAIVEKNVPKLATSRIRCLQSKQIHVTVHFFGHVSEEKLMTICRLLPEYLVNTFVFTCRITAIANFPKPQSTIIAAYVQLSQQLATVYAAVQNFLNQSGFDIEQRPYLPHITICRQNKYAKFTMPSIALPDYYFDATELVLYESKPTAQGSQYITLAKFKFKLFKQDY